MRRRTKRVLLAAGLFYILGSAPAWAGATVDPTTPDGLGGLFTIPNLAGGAGKTLFEATNDSNYELYTDLGLTDVGEKTAVILYAPFLGLGMAMVRLAIGLTWWLNALTSRDVGLSNLGTSLQSVAADLNVWLLPTALAVGAVIAYASARAGRDALGQVAWVMGLGIASIAMATSAPQILHTIDGARQLLARTVSAVGPNTSEISTTPFKWPGTDLDTGDPTRDLSRASGDAVWRSFAVVPWCQVQFGSQEACSRYGAKWLTLETNDDKKDFIETQVIPQEGGSDDAATVRFIKGHNPSDRIVVSLFALVNGIGVLLVIGGLALLALMPWVTALLLLFLSTVFLCLLCVPGRPRQLGMTFLNTVAGLVLLSALSTGVLTGALLAVTAVTSIAPTQGWLPAAVMTTAILVAAWHARSILERIVFVAGASAGSRMGGLAAATGYLAMRRAFSRSPRSSSGTKAGAPKSGSGPETAGTATSRRGAAPGTPRFASYGRGNGRASGAAAPAAAGGQGHTPTATTNPRGAWQRGNGHPEAEPSRWHPRESATSSSRRTTSRPARPDIARARERLARRERGEAPPSRGSYASRYEQPTKSPRAKGVAQPKGPRFTDYTSQQRRSRAKSTSAATASRPQPRWSRSRRRDEGQE